MRRLFWMWQTGFNVFAVVLIVLLVVIFVKGKNSFLQIVSTELTLGPRAVLTHRQGRHLPRASDF